jgi:hypothetical protein
VNARGKTWFGTEPRAEVKIAPLENQRIAIAPRVGASPDVMIEGKAAVTRSDVVAQEKLPPGAYLVWITCVERRTGTGSTSSCG